MKQGKDCTSKNRWWGVCADGRGKDWGHSFLVGSPAHIYMNRRCFLDFY